jgi:CubicO group peptidase (beta-lactamase class C family)
MSHVKILTAPLARGPAVRVAPVAVICLLSGCAASQTLNERFAAMPNVDAVTADPSWYRPLQRVRGARPTAAELLAGDVTGDLRWQAARAVADRYESGSIVVRQHGKVVAQWHDEPGGAAQRFDSQSMHRGLMALLVGAALADGTLRSLDMPLAELLREWRDDPRGAITLRDLFYGRSGLSDPPFELRADNAGMQLFIGTELANLVLAQPRGTGPGRGGALESQLLGIALERASGRPYAEYLSQRLWQPIGAADAIVRLDRPNGNTRTLCCLQASALSWARVGQLVLDEGRVGERQVLPASWIATLKTPNPDAPNTSMFWFLEPTALTPRAFGTEQAPRKATPFARPGVLYAGGRGGLRVYVIPSLDAVVVRLGKLRYDFDDGEFLNAFIAALAPTN